MLLHLAPSLRTNGIEDWYRIDIGSCLVGNNVSLNFPTNIAAISTLCRCVILLRLQYRTLIH